MGAVRVQRDYVPATNELHEPGQPISGLLARWENGKSRSGARSTRSGPGN
jgi:hypothetical protein